jgi:hypothetical protein
MGDWDLPEAAADPYVGLEEPDYAKFENVSVALRSKFAHSYLSIAVDPSVRPTREAVWLLPCQTFELLYHTRRAWLHIVQCLVSTV